MQEEYGSDRVIAEGVDVTLLARDIWMRHISLAALKTGSMAIKRIADMGGRGKYLSLFFGSPVGHFLIRYLSLLLTPRHTFDSLFKKYLPTMVFSTDVQNDFDVRLMHEARGKGVPVAGMVRSWDNLTTKGFLRIVPDVLFVQNKLTASDAVRFHRVPDNILKIVGIPHYDAYVKERTCDRAILVRNGLSLKKRIIVYVVFGDRYIKKNTVDCEVLDILASLSSSDESIIVRLPIADTVQCLDVNRERTGIFFEQVDKQRFARRKFVELSRDEDLHLQNLLRCADIVVTGHSTISIDAVLFNKPTILIGFDGKQKRPYYDSVARYYDYDYFDSVLASGGVWHVKSERSLREAMTAYRKNPALHTEERKKIVHEQTGGLLGSSCSNLANSLIEFMNSKV